MELAIFDLETTLEATDSDPRLQVAALRAEDLRRNCEATVSKNVSKTADTWPAPREHPADTLTAP